MIVGASDRMLSAADIKFEPPQMKIYRITKNIVALVAGDPSAQISMCYATERTLHARRLNRKSAETVEEAAGVYAEAFSAHRRELAVTKYLKPLGLDAHEFIERQSEFRGDFVTEIMARLQSHALDAETIIAGVDDTGPHIFTITDPGVASCMDTIAFASIGSGKHHADAQFMLAHHTKNTFVHTALLQTYAAKKRAEGSPTVGNWTDLFYITADGFQLLHEDLVGEYHNVYSRFDERVRVNQQMADEDAKKTLVQFLQRGSEASQSEEETLPPPPQTKRKRTPKIKPH